MKATNRGILMGNEVTILIPGYAEWTGPGKQRASGTITLIRGDKNVLVDTGVPTQRDELLAKLKEHGLAVNDIDYVVNTHGQSDHVGNNSLFPEATFLLDTDVSQGDSYSVHDFNADAFHVATGVSVIATPGHTDHDVSVVVETDNGIIVVAGDTFEDYEDWIKNSWEPWSKHKDDQRKSREKILRIADYIVPGHGGMFRAPSLATLHLGPALDRYAGGDQFLKAPRVAALIAEYASRFQTHWSRITEDRIRNWLLQFGGYYDLQSIFILLNHIEYIDEEKICDIFREFYDSFASKQEKQPAFCLLGGPKDSSSQIGYLCSKIFDESTRREIVFDNLEALAQAYDPEELSVVFLDDTIASGHQAVRIFSEWLDVSHAGEHVKPLAKDTASWLRTAKLTFFTVIGFREGMDQIRSALAEMGLEIDVRAAKVVQAAEGCFDAKSLIFENPQVRLHARKLALEIGCELFADRVDWDTKKRESMALGYGNAQKLIVFSHNTPNCTLPILWKKGQYGGKEWIPLFPRRD